MSGPRIPGGAVPRSSSPACGRAFWDPSSELPGRALNPRPAAIANSARNASAATIHGNGLVAGRRTAVADAGAPQRWQNLAPGDSGDAHDAHVAPESGEPQLAQKRPVAVAPQDGHVPEVGGVGGESDVTSLKLQGREAECSAQGSPANCPCSGCWIPNLVLAQELAGVPLWQSHGRMRVSLLAQSP